MFTSMYTIFICFLRPLLCTTGLPGSHDQHIHLISTHQLPMIMYRTRACFVRIILLVLNRLTLSSPIVLHQYRSVGLGFHTNKVHIVAASQAGYSVSTITNNYSMKELLPHTCMRGLKISQLVSAENIKRHPKRW